MTKPREVTSSRLKSHTGEELDRVARDKESLLITRHGMPVALVVPVDRDGKPVTPSTTEES